MSDMHRTVNTLFSPEYTFPAPNKTNIGIYEDGTGGTDYLRCHKLIKYKYTKGFDWYPNHRIYE